ncbi:unnamed protein product [Closterium sp. NIES-64]|nr:unnamed protein product [Closterium sp. NIES-64]
MPDTHSTPLDPSLGPSISRYQDVVSGTKRKYRGDKESSSRSDWVIGEDFEEPYVISQPVDFDKGLIQEIEVLVEAHDQGWSDYPQDHNTYNNSWTYAELAKLMPDGSLSASRELIYCNLHAVERWQQHSKTWSAADSQFVQSLQAGDRVAVVLRAQFPGWTHYVKWGKIDIMYDRNVVGGPSDTSQGTCKKQKVH